MATTETSVPPVSWTPAGFVAPQEADILVGVQADIDSAMGGGLNPALTEPQGQLASSMTAVIGNVNDTFLYYTNQVDPAFAQGRMQDAIGRIYYIERIPGAPTVAQCVCRGAQGVIIPVNAVALATDGNTYLCQETGVIPASGQITLPFACSVEGPITCPADSINQIYRTIPGWDSIDNPSAGVPGRDVESQRQFETRRAASTALNSAGSVPSVRGAVLDVSGVIDAFVTENNTGSPISVGGVTLAAHSIYVGVAGGAASDVATAIWTRKGPGCDYTGTTTQTVYDTSEGYIPPYPAYTVKFTYVDNLSIVFKVSIVNSTAVPSDAAQQIQAAIVGAFSGQDGGPPVRIGQTLLASRFYAAVAKLGSWAQIISLLIGSANNPGAEITGSSISGTTLTVGAVGSGTVAVDQFVFGTGVVAGTQITAGSMSTWTVSQSQTVGSEAMTLVAPLLTSIDVDIDQIPVVDPANIWVVLV